jgi:oxygen-independent coproporphyrinogen-3 oxidase
LKPDFLRALLKEIEMTADTPISFDTVYIGGGTPSVLDARDIEQIIDCVGKSYTILHDPEMTIEVNPGATGPEQLLDFRRAGINRINIGVQSFQPIPLQFLGRIHSQKDAHQVIRWARDAGFENLGIDLMYGLPDQTKKSWLRDLQEAVAFEPEHLSCYMLTYAADTPMDRQRRAGRFSPMDDAYLADLFETTITYLEANQFDQYEVSNFEKSDPETKASYRSKHNQKYWTYAPYLGLGPSAHSFIEPDRHWNGRDVNHYISELYAGRLPIDEKEHLDEEQQMIEWVYLGLRQTDGIPIDRFNRHFDGDFYGIFGKIVDGLKAERLIEADDARCALTRNGMLFLDSIVDRFLAADSK